MQIAKKLQAIWICMLANVLIREANSWSQFQNAVDIAEFFNPSDLVKAFFAATYLITIAQLVMVFQLRRESRRFIWAFGLYLVALSTSLVSFALFPLLIIFAAFWLIFAFFGLLSGNGHGSSDSLNTFASVFSPISIIYAISTLGASYSFFWALDERIITHNYSYPLKRIRWCFYALLTGMVLKPMLSILPNLMPNMALSDQDLMLMRTAITLISNGVCLALFFQYIQAVQAAESNC